MKVLALALASVLIVGAKAPTQTPRESIDVTVVEVPVTVVDGNGKPIRGLTRENFELYDDGKRRELTHFDSVDVTTRLRGVAPTSDAAAASAETDGPLPEQRPYLRNFMLLFDLSDSSPATLKRAREAALDFVEHQVQPVDRIAVGTVSVQRGFELLANFTLDREFVRAVVTTFGETRHFQSHDPLLLSVGDYDFLAQNAAVPAGLAAARAAWRANSSPTWPASSAKACARSSAARRCGASGTSPTWDACSIASPAASRSCCSAKASTRAPYRGAKTSTMPTPSGERSAIEHGQVWNVDTEARYGSSDALNTLQRMVETLRRSDVVLHALDIKGLRNVLDETGQRVNSTESLSLLTRDTGGSVFQNSNDLRQNFSRLLEQQDVTYVLGFETWARAPTSSTTCASSS